MCLCYYISSTNRNLNEKLIETRILIYNLNATKKRKDVHESYG